MTRWKAYVLGFNPEWSNANQNLCKRLIAESDFCIKRAEGIAIGENISTYTLVDGKPNVNIPRNMFCVGHEYNGKVVLLSDKE